MSRTGRRLLESGLVTRRKVGRQAYWQLTPRGRTALEDAPAPQTTTEHGLLAGGPAARLQGCVRRRARRAPRGRSHPGANHRVLSRAPHHKGDPGDDLAGDRRQGGRAAGDRRGDVPDAGRPGQKLRAALSSRASSCRLQTWRPRSSPAPLRRTSASGGWSRRSSAPTSAAERHRHRAPGAKRRAGGGRNDDGARQLVRCPGRRGRAPAAADSSSVAALRALTDVEVWRTLRNGATADAAVDQASVAVERWLEAQPSR